MARGREIDEEEGEGGGREGGGQDRRPSKDAREAAVAGQGSWKSDKLDWVVGYIVWWCFYKLWAGEEGV